MPKTPTSRRYFNFTRSVTLLVLTTFTSMILSPTVLAAQTTGVQPKILNTTTTSASQPKSDEAQFSEYLQATGERISKLNKRLQDHPNDLIDTDVQALNTDQTQIDALNSKVLANFDAIKTQLTQKNVAPIILQRQADTVKQYQTELAQFKTELDAITQSQDNPSKKSALEKAEQHLKDKPVKRHQQAFDPNDLPNSTLKAKGEHKPKETKQDYSDAGLYSTPNVQLAALGDFKVDQLKEADNPAYLSESDEITLTPAIQAQAAALDYDPVKIYHWVRNTIEWQPTWGAIQSAELTLDVKSGNAMDIASLTIALLRASKIPARYVHGTIDVPIEKFKNWAGGFTDTNAAIQYAADGGTPITAIISAGQINKVRMEHIWVEAAIDYFPSRGAKNKAADSWIALDPSAKQYTYLKGLDAVQISGIDPTQLAQNFINSGTVNNAEGWVTGFNPQILNDAQTQAQQKLQAYIQNNLTNPTVGDIIGGRKTIVKDYPILPAGTPYPIVVRGAKYDKLPQALQQSISWALAKDALGQPQDPISYPFAKVNNQKITLSFKPATPADEQVLQALLPTGQITDLSQLPTSIPSYLIQVIPELKLNGQTIKTGNSMKLGEELPLITQVSYAGRGQTQGPRVYNVVAGSYLSVNAIAGKVSASQLTQLKTTLARTQTKLQSQDQAQLAALTKEDLLGDLFRVGTLGYYAQLIGLNYLLGLQSGGHYQVAAGLGTVGYEPNVSTFFGIPRAITPGGISLDIPMTTINGVNDGDLQKKKQFVLQTGIVSSTLEHAVPEQMFVTAQNPGEAISAVKAIQKASMAGQRIYQITPANQATTLNNIHHDQNTMTEIQNALNAGKEIITHTDAVGVPGWTGAGYIILDPQTGEGAFKIAGGGNGGYFAAFIAEFIMWVFIVSITSGTVLSLAAPLALFALVVITTNGFLKAAGCNSGIGSDVSSWGSIALSSLFTLGNTPANFFGALGFISGAAALMYLSNTCNVVPFR